VTARYGANFAKHQEVIVTTNDPAQAAEQTPWSAVDFHKPTYFSTQGANPRPCLLYDFKSRRVKPTAYSIRSARWPKGGHHLREWQVEGSVDGSTWLPRHAQTNCSALNARQATATWPLAGGAAEFRYIKLTMTGDAWSCARWLTLEAWEVYGVHLEPLSDK
jgi:hypothetical protein